jgi:hypothetical protein
MFKAVLSKDRARVIMVDGTRRHTISAADLPNWLRLYRELRDRKAKPPKPGPYAKFYAPVVEALERVADQLREGAR